MASRRGIGTAWLLLAAMAARGADEPARHLFPVAGKRGRTVAVSVSGKFDPWPQATWTDTPGVTFTPEAKAGTYQVAIAEDAPSGPHLVRFLGKAGASAPRFFLVTKDDDAPEKEPNDLPAAAPAVDALPATISGRLEKAGDVDAFAVKLQRGQTLVARVEAYVLASAFDALLRVTDAAGNVVAFQHDGRTLDPLLAWTAPADGTYVVQVAGFVYPATADVRFTGGEGCVYRLHLTTGPFVRFTLPLAVPRGAKTPVELIGWNLPAPRAVIDATNLAAGTATLEVPAALGLSDQPLAVSDHAEALETEPNNSREQAARIELPGAVSGRIGAAEDEDRFTFTATKQKIYELSVTAARAGSPLDAWLKIENQDGKELARGDDAEGGRDPRLTWTAPADGDFTVAIGDVTHHGGADFVYRVAVVEKALAPVATTATHAVTLAAGKTAEWKVAVKRAAGDPAKLVLAAKNLPDGVSAPDVEVPAKGGDVTLKLTASEEAAAAEQPVQFVVRAADTKAEFPVRYPLTTTSENNGVPQGYLELVIDATDQLWLSLTAAPAK